MWYIFSTLIYLPILVYGIPTYSICETGSIAATDFFLQTNTPGSQYTNSVSCKTDVTISGYILVNITSFATEGCCDFLRIGTVDGTVFSGSGLLARQYIIVKSPATLPLAPMEVLLMRVLSCRFVSISFPSLYRQLLVHHER